MNDIQLLSALAGAAPNNPAEAAALRKALTTSSGFVGVNLEAQAKLLMPLFAGLRRRVPGDTPREGAPQAQWRMQLGYGAFSFGASASFGTANGANGPATAESAVTIAADYTSQSINGGVQWEAIQQAQGWDNAMAIDTTMALSTLMRIEEMQVLFGNRAAITVGSLTTAYSTIHVVPTFSNAVWSVAVTAITGQGTLTNASSNSNTGESVISYADISVGASGADYLDVAWAAVPGALGYKVYANHSAGGGHTVGALYLCDPNTTLAYGSYSGGSAVLGTIGDHIVVPSGQTYVTVNHVQIYAIPANTQPTAPSSDATANTNVFEGMTSWCTKNTIYGQSITSGGSRANIDMLGQPLTPQSTGIYEFDQLLKSLWVNYHTSPSLILCSSNSIVSMGNKIAAAGNSNQIRLDVYNTRNNIIGGLYIGGYVNKFAASMIGSQVSIPVWAHPYMPDGTFLFLSEDVPAETLPYSRTGKAFGLDIQTPYTYFELGRTDRSFPYDVFYSETLKCYWPNSQAAIVGARVDA